MRGSTDFVSSAVVGCTIFFSCSVTSAALATNQGRFELAGSHSRYGPFHGELEIRENSDGTVTVNRLVEFADFRFENHPVQEVWSGQGVVSAGRISARFTIRRADLFSRVDSVVRRGDDFLNPAVVDYELDLNCSAESSVRGLPDGDRRESCVGRPRPNGPASIWRADVRLIPSYGRPDPLIGNLAQWTVLAPAIESYRSDPFVAKYHDRQEFRDRMQYFIADRTDFDFLRENPDRIRVPNKVLDLISMAEESLRRDAYGPTLMEKAEIFDEEMARDHLNDLGLYEMAEVDQNGRVLDRHVNGDSGLWSGMYAASQAMRWQVTRDPAALANFRLALGGIMLLMDVTGERREFARTARSGSATGNLIAGKPPYQHLSYLPGGNNDMIKGIFVALAWAFEVLPETDPMWPEIRSHAARMSALRVAGEVSHSRNMLIALGLAALSDSGLPERKQAYLSFHNSLIQVINATGLDTGFYHGGIADWSGINLGMVGKTAEIVLARQLARRFPGDRGILRALSSAQKDLADLRDYYREARRGFLSLASYGLADRRVSAEELDQALWMLREVPISGTRHFIEYDFSLRPDWCASAWPMRPWKYWSGAENRDYYQGAYQFPLFAGYSIMSDNLWTSAFDFRGAGLGRLRHGRIEYLFTYWVARLGGLIGPES